jgi:hypothetical protein
VVGVIKSSLERGAKRRAWLLELALAFAWLAAVAGGLTAMARYGGAAGKAAAAPSRWPTDSRIVRQVGRPQLVLLAHPMCPCTRATLAELNRLVGRLGDHAAQISVVFIHPHGTGEDWQRSDLWDRARAISGVDVIEDPGGVEAERFGSYTSGQVLLYAVGGELMFNGGLTVSRGHEGDNPGADRIVALLHGARPDLETSPVFGCPLHDPGSKGE